MSQTLLAVALLAAVVVAVVTAAAGGVVVADVRAQAAADAAALAAAHATRTTTSPTGAARAAAATHGAALVACDCDGRTVHVEVVVPVAVRAARLSGIPVRRAAATARLVPTYARRTIRRSWTTPPVVGRWYA